MPLKKTQEQAIKDLISVHGTEKYDYSLVTYTTVRGYINIKCNTCQVDFHIKYDHHRQGRGCKIWGLRKSKECNRKTNDQFLQDLRKITKSIIPLEEYKGHYSKIGCKCSICSQTWYTTPNRLLRGAGCHFCAGNVAHTFQSLSEAIVQVHNGEIILLPHQKIKGVLKKYWMRHSTCGHEWYTVANDIVRGKSCPKCAISGYKPDKQGVFYILLISGDEQFTGFGISNNYQKRKTQHKRNLKLNNCSILSEILISSDGLTIQNLERYIKETLHTNNSNVKGFKTESVLISKEELLDICLSWLTSNTKLYNIESITI